MTDDIETLTTWLQIFLGIAAVSCTLFPLLWAFSPWWRTQIGRLLMLQSVALALAVDLTAYFQFWPPSLDHIIFLFWLQAAVFGLIALASVLLTVTMVRMNYLDRKEANQDV